MKIKIDLEIRATTGIGASLDAVKQVVFNALLEHAASGSNTNLIVVFDEDDANLGFKYYCEVFL